MSLRDELEGPKGSGQHCLTCAFIARQPAFNQAEWVELLRDEGVTTAQLWTLARKKGFEGGQTAFRHHRMYHKKAQS